MFGAPNRKVLAFLLIAYAIEFVVLAFHPVDRSTWFVENATVWIILGIILTLYARKIRFSTAAYVWMSILIFLHTIGGHWTFANVPFTWGTDILRFLGLDPTRNHFDRMAHFTVGFYAYPMAEWLWAKRLVATRFILLTYPILAIASVAVFYEWVEWIFAITNDPAAGAAYLGSQGDEWDAQKDMLADTLGAVLAIIGFAFAKGWRSLREGLLSR